MHSHTWVEANRALRRYRCTECQVLGYRHPHKRGVVPYKCQHDIGGKHCAQDAV